MLRTFLLSISLAMAGPVLMLGMPGGALAATSANAQSPLGINLISVNYYSVEQPYLNIVKTVALAPSDSSGWITRSIKIPGAPFNTNEQAYLQLDANGWPTSLTPSSADPNPQFDSAGFLLLRNIAQANAGTGITYPSGQYVVLYDGEGTLAYSFDATLASSAPGRDVLNVKATGGGIMVLITSTDPNHTGNYLRNIRLVRAQYEASLNAGAIFNPVFLNVLKNFRLIRAMQWLSIDSEGGKMVTWAQRPHLTDGGYGGAYGTPIESALQLCNAVGADCWVNIPHAANADYVTQMAILAHNMLGKSQKLYIEFSNEVWNPSFAQFHYAVAQGQATWPTAAAYLWGSNWYGMQTAKTCDIWKSTWGSDSSRVVCVLGAQAVNAFTATSALDCSLWTGAGNAPCASHGIGAVATAPYFGYITPSATWASEADNGLSSLFGLLDGTNGDLQVQSNYEAKMAAALSPYSLPMISYEGGQTLVAFPKYAWGSPISNLYVSANRDPRMGAAYTTALNAWKANGGTLYTIFADITGPSVYGDWGALENVNDTVAPLSASPPKWQAIQNFISNNKCWWSGCAGAIGGTTSPTPMAPTNLVVK